MASHGNGRTRDSRDGEFLESLHGKTRKELAQLARQQRIFGWHPMRKFELIDALAQAARQDGNRHKTSRRKPRQAAPTRITGVIGGQADLLVAEPVSSRWISARWNVSSRMLLRAESALGSDWHRARAVLRLLKITEEAEGPTSESRVRDTRVQIEAAECCVEVDRAGLSYRLQLGFTVPGGGDFFALSHSDPVTTHRRCQAENASGPSDSTKPTSKPRQSSSSENGNGHADLPLEIHTDLVIYGRTEPETLIELDAASVKVGRDGRFELRLPLENGRQFVPATATAADRTSRRNVALSIERHLKLLDPEPTN